MVTEADVRAKWVELCLSYDGCSIATDPDRFCDLIAAVNPSSVRAFFSQRTLENIESGCGVVSIGLIRKLCRAFGLHVDELEQPMTPAWLDAPRKLFQRYGCEIQPGNGRMPTVGCAYYLYEPTTNAMHWRNVVDGTPGSGPFTTIDGGAKDGAGFQAIAKARPQLRGYFDVLSGKSVGFWLDAVRLVMALLAKVGAAGLPGAPVTIEGVGTSAVKGAVTGAVAGAKPAPVAAGIVEGIDVSHYQASARFDEVARAGIGFVLVKLGQGSHLRPRYEDPSASALCARVRATGLLLGGYHYEMARPEDAKVQAEDFFEAWQRERCELAELDVEWMNNEKASPTQFRDATAVLLDRWDELSGRHPVFVYGSQSELDRALIHTITGISARPLSVANYGVSKPALPRAWKDWVLWQYAGNGRVPGVDGDCDRYKFRGTIDDLRRFGRSVSTAPLAA